MKNKLILEASQKAIITEAEKTKGVTSGKVDKMIRGVRDKLEDIAEALTEMGINPESTRMKQLKKMYHLLAELDPVSVKMAEDFVQPTQAAAQSMVEGDVKVSNDASKETIDTVQDLSKDLGSDIQVIDPKKD